MFLISWFLTTIAFVLTIVGGLVLLIAFGVRYYMTEKFMPAGVLALITVGGKHAQTLHF